MDHMNGTLLRTSSYSGGNGGECVQVAATPNAGHILVRDSKDPKARSSHELAGGAASPTASRISRAMTKRVPRALSIPGTSRSSSGT